MRKPVILIMCMFSIIASKAQSFEILDIIKNKLSNAQKIDDNLVNLKPFLESRQTNDNIYASKLMSNATNLEDQAIKGIYYAKKLKVKLNNADKSYWADEIDDLIYNFDKIKTGASLVQENASSLYYVFNTKEKVFQYYNEMISSNKSIISNANYAKQKINMLDEIRKWEMFSQNNSNTISDKEIQSYLIPKSINYDELETGCIEGDCENGYGIYISKSGMKRQGMFKNNILNGVGRIDSERGYYIGEFLDGYFNGFGIRIYNNGEKYMGSWQKGNKYGIGVFIKNDGSVLKGFFKNNTLTSEYVLTYTAYNFINKTKKGCLSGDCVNGYGTFIFDNGDLYIGTSKKGSLHGNGFYYWKSGKVYCGEFKEGKLDGFGSLILGIDVNLECYIGDFKNNKFSGNGTYINKDGTYKKGKWVEGEFKSN